MALHLAIENGHFKVIKFLIKKDAKCSVNNYAFNCVVKKGNLKIVNFLIKKGANIRDDNYIVLKLATLRGHLKIAKILVKRR